MADNSENEKTEDPTQKRLDDAYAKGDVAKSQEVNTWFVIAGATLVLSTFSEAMGGGILMPLRNLVANSWTIRTDGQSLLALAQNLEVALIAAIGVPLLMLMLAAIAGNMIQHRLVWSGESLKPKFSKVSPGAAFKRVFGKQALANFAKGVDLVAMKIREVARPHDIPVIENVPLARALYATVELDDEIPVEHYHAVAEIIGYIMGLKRGLSTRRS